MNIRITLIQRLCMVLMLVAAGFGLNACSDTATAPAPAGSSTVTIFHANPAYTSDVVVRNDTTTLATLAYGTSGTASVGNGSRSFTFRATDGTQLASTSITLDSTIAPWVIFSGDAGGKDGFSINTKKISATVGESAIRVINASKNAGDITLKVNSLTGASFTASALSYQKATDYVTFPSASTTKLIVLKGGNSILEIPLFLSDTKSYTVVIYGSTDAAAVAPYKLAGKVIAD
ncbi:MAG: hypothetical protein JWQ98_1640 [Chlorobi bacterium]|nr:hypothetical protein [Chlorobiota bacterium]